MTKTKTSASESGESAPPLGDMSAEEFRRHGHQIINWISDYLTRVEEFPVLAQVKPGELASKLPATAPAHGESMEAILADVDRLIVPALTQCSLLLAATLSLPASHYRSTVMAYY